ncbi:MAG: hypothetical protein RBT78_14250, partial [Kiritimatiellia bacterium]|nr:hypothetical protein [Kiritimatiellia bacterium]
MDEPRIEPFGELLDAVWDGTADETQTAALNRLLEQHPEYRKVYLRQARMHVLLGACAGVREAAGGERTAADGGGRRLSGLWWAAAATAMLLAGLAGLAVWRIPRTSSPGTDVRADFSPVMTVRASLHGQWADG